MALLTLIIGVELVPAGGSPRPIPQRIADDRVAVYRGTTSFQGANRRSAAPTAPALSLDRIRRKSERVGEGGSELLLPPGAAPVVGGTAVAGTPASLLTSFNGLGALDNLLSNDGFEFEPPDQGLCVGNGFVMESINSSIRVFGASGNPRSQVVSQNGFYGFAPIQDANGVWGPFLADPSCLYDPETRRWFHTILVLDTDPVTGDLVGPNSIDVAVSRTSNPTGNWDLFTIPAQNDGTEGTPDHGCVGEGDVGHGPCIGDYPHIGLDHNGFYITTNEYTLFGTTQFTGAQLYAMSKDALVSGGQSVAFVHIENLEVPERGQKGFTLRAANVPGTQWSTLKHGTVFFASGMVGFESGNVSPDYDAITLWALSNTASLDTASPNLKLRHKVVNTLPYQIPPPSAQRPGDLPLGECLNMAPCISAFGPPPSPQGLSVVDSLDGRMLGTWYANGLLWFSLGTAIEVGGEDLAGIMYGALGPPSRRASSRAGWRCRSTSPWRATRDHAGGRPGRERARLSGVHVRGSRSLPECSRGEDLLGNPASKVRVVQPGVGPQDGFSGYWIGGPRPGGVTTSTQPLTSRATCGRPSSSSPRRAPSTSGSAETSHAEAPAEPSRTSLPM